MKNLKSFTLAFILIFANKLQGYEYKRQDEACFPLTSLRHEVGDKNLNRGITESEFNLAIQVALTKMTPEVKKHLDKKLIIEGRWMDGTIDAYATRDDDNNAVIVMNGGLARHPGMTFNAFLVLICHEVGHHLGGAPKILRGNSGLRSWSSAEGQADYYATSKCLPTFFDTLYDLKESVTSASLTVSKVFASLMKGTQEPQLGNIDSSTVATTIYTHPKPQCRLDTYLAGASCEIDPDVPFDAVNPQIGACTRDKGIRPSCWFQEKDF